MTDDNVPLGELAALMTDTAPPNLNTGMPWADADDRDLRWAAENYSDVNQVANYLCRTPDEVRRRGRKLGISVPALPIVR